MMWPEKEWQKSAIHHPQHLTKSGDYMYMYCPKQCFEIGKYAKFSSILNRKDNESSVRSFKTVYVKEIDSRKRKLDYSGHDDFIELHSHKCVRKVQLRTE